MQTKYLSINKYGVYRFRIRIPQIYQCYFLKKEINKSLHTKEIRIANFLVNKYIIKFKEVIYKIEIGIEHNMLTRYEIDKIVKSYIADVLGRDSTARINKSSLDGLSDTQLPKGKQLSTTKDLLTMYQGHLKHLSLKPVVGIATEYVDDIDLEDLSHKELMFKLLQAQVTIYEELTSRNKVDFKINKTFETEANQKSSLPVQDALEVYLKYLKAKTSPTQYRDTSNFLSTIFIELVGKNSNINSDLESVIEELEVFEHFPRRNIYKYSTMSVTELKEIIDTIDEKDKISIANRKKQLIWIRAFYDYCFDMKFIDIPIHKYIQLPQGTNDQTQRLALSDKEVIKFFEASKSDTDMYLLLQVYAHTGMRTKEFFKMKIINSQFDLSDESIKLKTKSSYRKIPIPQHLLEKQLEIEDLQTKYDEKRVSKKLNKILDEFVIDDKKKTLYSLRHSVSTKLNNALIDERIINEILGHSRGKSMSINRYADRFDYDILKPVIDSINYGVAD